MTFYTQKHRKCFSHWSLEEKAFKFYLNFAPFHFDPSCLRCLWCRRPTWGTRWDCIKGHCTSSSVCLEVPWNHGGVTKATSQSPVLTLGNDLRCSFVTGSVNSSSEGLAPDHASREKSWEKLPTMFKHWVLRKTFQELSLPNTKHTSSRHPVFQHMTIYKPSKQPLHTLSDTGVFPLCRDGLSCRNAPCVASSPTVGTGSLTVPTVHQSIHR